MSLMNKLFAHGLVLLSIVKQIEAWGSDGHMIIADIAHSLLTEAEHSAVKNILHGQTMVEVASWADKVDHEKGKYRKTGPWHFIDMPDGDCSFDYELDCKKDNCVVGKILEFTNQIANISYSDTWSRREDRISQEEDESFWRSLSEGDDIVVDDNDAMKFLIHFVGDIHQPLHVGWTSDKGGNKIVVKEDFVHPPKSGHKLHVAWDSDMIHEIELELGGNPDPHWENLRDKVFQIVQGFSAQELAHYTQCISSDLKQCVSSWASESGNLACEVAYRDEYDPPKLVSDTKDLDTGYFERARPIIMRQLAKASVRLQSLLRFGLKSYREKQGRGIYIYV